MPRRYPNRRRRRPPRRRRPQGYTPPALRPFCDAVLPRGRRRRDVFNNISAAIPIACAASAALLGLSWAGPAGGLIGLIVGLGGGARLAVRQRFYRG